MGPDNLVSHGICKECLPRAYAEAGIPVPTLSEAAAALDRRGKEKTVSNEFHIPDIPSANCIDCGRKLEAHENIMCDDCLDRHYRILCDKHKHGRTLAIG